MPPVASATWRSSSGRGEASESSGPLDRTDTAAVPRSTGEPATSAEAWTL